MKRLEIIILTILVVFMFLGCSNNDENTTMNTSINSFYAIIQPEGAQITEILPEDYVITLDNIISVNPETGQFLMRNTERIDTKAFPIPTQYVITFYSEDKVLFSANLNSVISSYLPIGLTFCHILTDVKGVSLYDLGTNQIVRQDGEIEGKTSYQQEIGIQKMYEILTKAGKQTDKTEFDFQFE